MNKKPIITGLIVLILLSGIIFLLAYRANQELEIMVTEQFNNQQLILAGKIAEDLRSHFHFLESALITYKHGVNSNFGDSRLQGESRGRFDILKEWQVLALGVLHGSHEQSLVASSPDIRSWEDMGIEFPGNDFTDWMESNDKGRVFYGQTIKPAEGPFAGIFVMLMAMSMESENNAGRFINTGDDPRAVFMLVNASKVAARHAHGVVSGKTGYPWVINQQGYFLYHIEEDFLGRDSFTVRRERNPDISYDRINRLVEEKLLQGHEGMDWYVSGWHREAVTRMDKLFAYSPVIFSPEHESQPNLWSVGLAAPTADVYGLIQPIVIRQWIVAGLFLLIVASGFLGLYLLSLRWNQVLALKVEEKTRHLVHSQDLLQKEKEKVELSMENLVKAQEKLVQSERFAAIGEAAAHLSHEIKNPLMLMAGFARQVNRALPVDSPEKKKLDIIAGEAQRLEKMLNEVRDFTRPHVPKKELFDISKIINDTRNLLSTELDSGKIICRLKLSPDLPLVLIDQSQIKQVLLNLMKNALEAMPEGGSLTVSSWVDNSRVWISVQDTGEGISEDKIKNVFSPFFTTKDKGTGLGLAVCFRIVQDHGGEVFVESKEGQGSTFSFFLPVSSESR